MKRRAVITGLGIVSPIGVGVKTFWEGACAGRSGIGRIRSFDVSGLAPECQIGGEVIDFSPTDWMSARAAGASGRFSQFAVATAKMAFTDSGIGRVGIAAERLRVIFGTSMSGLVDVLLPDFEGFTRGENVVPWTAREFPGHAATSHVAREIGAAGGTTTVATACAAGLDAIEWAAESVRTNEADVVVAGATETPLAAPTLESFRAYGLLARWDGAPAAASRPFERRRSGLVVAEGAAAVVVEDEQHARTRGARVYAVILGAGAATEPGNGLRVERGGESAAKSMRQALERAHMRPEGIDYICAHGNAIPDHDAAETAAIKLAFGPQANCVPISSIKSMCGQAFAASSAMQVVTACLALRDNVIPPTINLGEPDPECDLDYVPNRSRVACVRHVLIHVRSIGGSHASMVLGRAG